VTPSVDGALVSEATPWIFLNTRLDDTTALPISRTTRPPTKSVDTALGIFVRFAAANEPTVPEPGVYVNSCELIIVDTTYKYPPPD
jgi:hypothetical protein